MRPLMRATAPHSANFACRQYYHPLKEVDAAAMAWATTPAQVVEILRYTTRA